MDCSISAHSDHHLISLLSCLLCQLNSMTWIDCPTPIHATVLFRDRTQVTCHAPCVSHVCHGVEDDFDFAMHALLSEKWILQQTLLWLMDLRKACFMLKDYNPRKIDRMLY